jgi:organic hydroperoxide reductase OsmC/OhrA
MRARLLFAASLACCLSTALPSVAAQKKLTTEEIQSAFAGNTVHGMWGQTEYYSRSMLLPKPQKSAVRSF